MADEPKKPEEQGQTQDEPERSPRDKAVYSDINQSQMDEDEDSPSSDSNQP